MPNNPSRRSANAQKALCSLLVVVHHLNCPAHIASSNQSSNHCQTKPPSHSTIWGTPPDQASKSCVTSVFESEAFMLPILVDVARGVVGAARSLRKLSARETLHV